MIFTFNPGIPATNNNPSADQPDMLTNNQSTDGILAVDHVSFNTANGGKHKFVQLPVGLVYNIPVAPIGNSSSIFANAGTASTTAQLFFQNSLATYHLSPIKAWGIGNGIAGGIVASQSVNVTSFVRNSLGNYTITLTVNAVSSANFAVLLSANQNIGLPQLRYTITGVGTFNVLNTLDVNELSFVVIQL